MRVKQKEQQVPTEYANVSRWTSYPDELNQFTKIAVTQEEAELFIKHFIPDCDVVFYPDAGGEAIYQRDPETGVTSKFIRLPNNPLTKEDIEAGISYQRLNLAVICHEVAHHLAGLHHHHDYEFTKMLDRVVLQAKNSNWKNLVEIEMERQINLEVKGLEDKRRRRGLSEILKAKCPICGKSAQTPIEVFEDENYFFALLECGHLVQTKKARVEGNKLDSFKSIKGEALYPFQKENVEQFSRAKNRILIADEMGLGKTPSSIAITKVYEDMFPALCVVKSGLRHQYARMWEYWGQEEIVQIIDGSKDRPLKGMPVYIVSYDLLARLPSDYFQKCINIKGNEEKLEIKTLIIDECQQIKNPDAQRSREVTALAAKIPNVVATSGTPIKNNASEYYTILHALRPDLFPTFASFVTRHVDTYMKGPYVKYAGLKNPARFMELTEDFVIRHTQREVLPQLPDITRDFRYIDIDGAEAEADYEDTVKEFGKFYYSSKKQDFSFFSSILEYLAKMRHQVGLMKVDATVDFVQEFLESTDRKIVIFAHHVDVRAELKSRLSKYAFDSGIKLPIMFEAGMDGNEKERLQELFNTDPSYRFAIASTLASGEGMNLQGMCSDCVMMERQWNPANEEQAEFRFKRIGQVASKISAYYIIALGTLDEYFTELVEKKREVMKQTLDGKAINWSENEILNELASIIATKSIDKYSLPKKGKDY